MIAVRNWSVLLLTLGLLLATSALRAQPMEILGSAEETIARADALGANKDFDGAIRLLNDAIVRFPSYSRVYLALATWQEVRGLFSMPVNTSSLDDRKVILRQHLNEYPEVAKDIFETYGRATMFLPDTDDIRQRVEGLTTHDFPVELGEYGPLALPGDPMPVVYTISDPQLPVEMRGVYQGLITTRPLPIEQADPGELGSGTHENYAADPKYGKDDKYANDPKYGHWSFEKMLYAYDFDNHKKTWNLRFRVMWQNVPGQQENRARLARQCAQLLLRLSGLLRAYTGLTPLFSSDGVVNVWLAERGDAGGEAYNENIYLQEVGTQRTPTEWIRELAHEFGHQTLPAVGGYVKPERIANGVLGERLFIRWLLQNIDPASETQAWVRGLKPTEFKDARINRLVRQFATLGPEMPQLRATDAAAMENFVGMALYLDMTQGSSTLAGALKSMTTPAYSGPNGFLQSVESMAAYQQSSAQPVVTLHLSELPTNVPLWVYLTDGAWKGEIETRDNATLNLKVDVDGKESKIDLTSHFTTAVLQKGWHRLHLTPEDKVPSTLISLKLIRQ